MRKLIVLIFAFIFTINMVGCSKIVGEEGLIAKARQEINLAEADTIEMVIAGKSTIDHTTHLFWFVTGNEYQMNRPHPIEFRELKDNEYEFVHSYNPISRGQDIYALLWHDGYSFFINNEKCKTIRIDDYTGVKEIEVTEYPFIYYNSLLPREYTFLDADGNEIE